MTNLVMCVPYFTSPLILFVNITSHQLSSGIIV
uniref:Uncharacterized protein n=1 Tax=Arundo donax TaxID=35708 RepID=A0A0A9AG36_ARUDO